MKRRLELVKCTDKEGLNIATCWHFLTSLMLGCHPQHDTKSVVVLYLCHLTK
jgi:hypothetical protein